MNTRPALLIIIACVWLVPLSKANAQPVDQAPTAKIDQPVDQWDMTLTSRLEQLDPAHPQDYYFLAEEIVASAGAESDYVLARRLYVLTIIHAARKPETTTLAASAAVALADISRAESDRRALWAIARSLDPRYSVRDWSRSTDITVTDDLAYETAVTLGRIRAGRGTLALADLRKPGIRDLITRYSAMITGSINQDILPELEGQAQAWPCPECRNERIVTKRHTGKIERRICYTCNGNPGPELTTRQLIGQLRFESFLLNGRQRSWGAQVAADLGEPLRDADLATMPLRFGVDPDLLLYRDGDWIAPQVSSPQDEPEVSEP